jgi:hypothetical protein
VSDTKSSAVQWSAVVTIAVALALGVFAMNPLPIGAFHDDARYLLLARSIAEGTGYRFVLTPGAPAGTHFPPVFPLVLAALWKIAPAFPASETLFKLLNALMLPLAAFATFTFARVRGGLAPWAACAVALAFACSVPVLFLDGVLFSEPFFIAALLGTLLLCERTLRGRTFEGDSWSLYGLAFAAGLAIGGVTMIRTLGIALGVGLAVALTLRRQWTSLVNAVGGMITIVGPWQTWTMRHGGEIPPILAGDLGTYGSWVGAALHSEGNGFIVRVAEANVKGFSILLELFGVSGIMAAIVAVPLMIALGIGLRRLYRTAPVSVASLAVYLLVVLIWPGTPDRFLWPVWPILLTAVACGASEIVKWNSAVARTRVARGAMLAALCVCALLFLKFNIGMYGSRAWENPARANAKLAIAASETAAALPPGLVASEFDAMVSLYTGRPAIPLLPLMAANYLRPRTPREAAAQLLQIIDAYHPSFLLVGSGEALQAATILAHAESPRIRFNSVSPSGILLYVPVSP